MIRTILIPTDFRIESLNTLKYALQESSAYEVEIILLYTEFLNDSITGLLFYSPESIIKPHLSDEFAEALSIIRNKYTWLSSIRMEVLHSRNIGVFTQFLKKQKVDEIYLPATYTLQLTKRGFDPLPSLKASGFPIREAFWRREVVSHRQNGLDELLRPEF